MSDVTKIAQEPGGGLNFSLRVRTFDTEQLRSAFPRWDEIPTEYQKQLLDAAHAEGIINAKRDSRHTNATCHALHRYTSKMLAAQTSDQARRSLDPPTAIILGDNWGTGTSPDPSQFTTTDTGLNNEIGRIQLSDPVGINRDWTAQELIGSLELDTDILREWGVVSESGELWNHGPINPELNRSGEATALLDVSIPIRDASEL